MPIVPWMDFHLHRRVLRLFEALFDVFLAQASFYKPRSIGDQKFLKIVFRGDEVDRGFRE